MFKKHNNLFAAAESNSLHRQGKPEAKCEVSFHPVLCSFSPFCLATHQQGPSTWVLSPCIGYFISLYRLPGNYLIGYNVWVTISGSSKAICIKIGHRCLKLVAFRLYFLGFVSNSLKHSLSLPFLPINTLWPEQLDSSEISFELSVT